MGIRKMVLSLGMPVEIAGTFSNGRSALENMAGLRPDIVITDVRMPVMNGLQLIEEAKALYPSVEFIILSGYSDFEYARTAMKFGISDYVLKPSTEEEFSQVLGNVCDRVLKNRYEFERKYIQNLLFSSMEPTSEKPASQKEYPYHYLALLCMGSFSIKSVDYIKPQLPCWNSYALEKLLNEEPGGNYRCFAFDAAVSNEKVILLSTLDTSVIHVQKIVNRLAANLGQGRMPLTIVLSDLFGDISQLRPIYHDCRICLGNEIVTGKSRVILREKEKPAEKYLAVSNSERQNIQALLHRDDLNGVVQEFLRLSSDWEKAGIPQNICEFSVKYIVSEIYCHNTGLQKQYLLEQLLSRVEVAISSAVYFEDFRSGIVKILNDLAKDSLNGKLNLKIHEVVDLLYDFIRNNYMQQISIEQFARQFGYNSTYISNTFTSVVGVSPYRLITSLRIEKSKELLASFDCPLKDIAEMVGYNDVSYFSRVFKEISGYSPKHFRNQQPH